MIEITSSAPQITMPRMSREARINLIPYEGMTIYDIDDNEVKTYWIDWKPTNELESSVDGLWDKLREISKRHKFIWLNSKVDSWIWYEIVGECISIHKQYLAMINDCETNVKIAVLKNMSESLD